MVVVKGVLREPLFHFLLLALTILVCSRFLGTDAQSQPGIIVVTAPKVEQMATVFTRTWQRSPTADELKAMIDDYVKEEILVREALSLGLDRDDTVVRRRLRQKMEFIDAAAADVLSPTDVELDAFLQANRAIFEPDPMLAFQQVFLSPQRHGDRIALDAAIALKALRTDLNSDAALLGDPSFLPPNLPLSGTTEIGQIFGKDFTKQLQKAPLDQWTGPVVSSFGFHLIRVSQRIPGRVPALDAVRDAVLREWANARRKALEDQRFAELLKRYRVQVEFPVPAKAAS